MDTGRDSEFSFGDAVVAKKNQDIAQRSNLFEILFSPESVLGKEEKDTRYWTILGVRCFMVLALLAYTLMLLVQYMQNTDPTTNIDTVLESPIAFPAITVCPLDPEVRLKNRCSLRHSPSGGCSYGSQLCNGDTVDVETPNGLTQCRRYNTDSALATDRALDNMIVLAVADTTLYPDADVLQAMVMVHPPHVDPELGNQEATVLFTPYDKATFAFVSKQKETDLTGSTKEFYETQASFADVQFNAFNYTAINCTDPVQAAANPEDCPESETRQSDLLSAFDDPACRHIIFTVMFNSLFVEHTTQVDPPGILELFAAFGGAGGLFLGLSLIGIVEWVFALGHVHRMRKGLDKHNMRVGQNIREGRAWS